MALSGNTPQNVVEGDFMDFPVAASQTIYEGSMVGLSSGYARALTAGDTFVGHAFAKAVEATAADGGVDVKVRSGIYRMKVTLASVAVSDVGKDVYASDDGTYTLTQGSNSYVGRVAQYVAANTCVVEFRTHLGAAGADVPNHQHTGGTDGGALTSPHIVTAIEDTNGNEVFKITATTTAVNEITVANAATGNGPSMAATGGDASIDIALAAKGTGSVLLGQATSAGVKLVASQPILDENGAELVKFVATGSAVNEVTVTNAATGNSPGLSATGSDTNIGIGLTAKGTGTIEANSSITIADAKNVILNTTTGSQIGTAAGQKLALWGATPAVQRSHVADPSGGGTQDAEARSAINSILASLEALGLHATS